MLRALLNLALDICMVVAPVAGYVDYLRKITQSRSYEGFSTNVSLILLVANCLRVFYWYGERFETVMLLYSLVMIAAYLVVLYICCQYPRPDQKGRSLLRPAAASYQIIGGDAGFHRMATSSSTIQDLRASFWNWEDIGSYVFFLTAFNSLLVMLTLLFGMVTSEHGKWAYEYSGSYTYYQVLGYLALMVEAVLPMPQIISNWRKKSVYGLSLVMVGTWFLGDAYKTFYFLMRGLPAPFILCGAFYLAYDIVIVAQVVYYSNKK